MMSQILSDIKDDDEYCNGNNKDSFCLSETGFLSDDAFFDIEISFELNSVDVVVDRERKTDLSECDDTSASPLLSRPINTSTLKGSTQSNNAPSPAPRKGGFIDLSEDSSRTAVEEEETPIFPRRRRRRNRLLITSQMSIPSTTKSQRPTRESLVSVDSPLSTIKKRHRRKRTAIADDSPLSTIHKSIVSDTSEESEAEHQDVFKFAAFDSSVRHQNRS